MPAPKVSALFTVYNKAGYLARTIASVRAQMPDERQIEYIFADDVSTDTSRQVIEHAMQGAPNVQILRNKTNRGPSVRLNQAAEAATGEFLYFLDSDDLAAPGTIPAMLALLDIAKADLIYGKTEKETLAIGAEPRPVSGREGYEISSTPLETMLVKGGFVRMTLMCSRDLYARSGGADERVFIQDESLPLRLGMHAQRLIDWEAKVVYRQPDPEGGEHISSNQDQLQHDAFLAVANALEDAPITKAHLRPLLYSRAVSQHWKMRKRHGARPLLSGDYWRYQRSRGGVAPNVKALKAMREDFAELENVRRMSVDP